MNVKDQQKNIKLFLSAFLFLMFLSVASATIVDLKSDSDCPFGFVVQNLTNKNKVECVNVSAVINITINSSFNYSAVNETLNSVTTRGNITTNKITVGSLGVNVTNPITKVQITGASTLYLNVSGAEPEIKASSSGIQLTANGQGIFRGLDGWTGTWSDSAPTTFFQVGRNSGNTTFSARQGLAFNRLQFYATNTLIGGTSTANKGLTDVLEVRPVSSTLSNKTLFGVKATGATYINTTLATVVPLTIYGNTSQSVDLQDWYKGTSKIAYVNNVGQIYQRTGYPVCDSGNIASTCGALTSGSVTLQVAHDAGYSISDYGNKYMEIMNGYSGLYVTDYSNGKTVTLTDDYYGLTAYGGAYVNDGMGNTVIIADGTNALSITGNQIFQSGNIIDIYSLYSIDTNARSLYSNDGSTAVLKYDYSGGLYGGSGSPNGMIDLVEGKLEQYTGSDTTSIDWVNRNLYDQFGSFVATWYDQGKIWGGYDGSSAYYYSLDMNNALLADPSGTSIDFSNNYLYSSGNILALDWEQRKLHDNTGAEVVQWGDGTNAMTITGNQMFTNGYIVDNLGGYVPSIDTNNRMLGDDAHGYSIDWDNRLLINSSGQTVLDWSTAIDMPEVDTLQIITDRGSVTTNNITVAGIKSGTKMSLDSTNRVLYADDGTTVAMNYSIPEAVSIGNAGIPMLASVFIGIYAGYNSQNIVAGNYIGGNAGGYSDDGQSCTFIGDGAGYDADNCYYGLMLGSDAGKYSNTSVYPTFVGTSAGYNSEKSADSTMIGWFSGYNSYNMYLSTAIGSYSGSDTFNTTHSTLIGNSAGAYSEQAGYSTFIGGDAGARTKNIYGSIFLGEGSGYGQTRANNSVFIGQYSGTTYTLNSIDFKNNFILDSVTSLRANANITKTNALMYGTFASTRENQQLTINAGNITLNGTVKATSFNFSGIAGTGNYLCINGTAGNLFRNTSCP